MGLSGAETTSTLDYAQVSQDTLFLESLRTSKCISASDVEDFEQNMCVTAGEEPKGRYSLQKEDLKKANHILTQRRECKLINVLI